MMKWSEVRLHHVLIWIAMIIGIVMVAYGVIIRSNEHIYTSNQSMSMVITGAIILVISGIIGSAIFPDDKKKLEELKKKKEELEIEKLEKEIEELKKKAKS